MDNFFTNTLADLTLHPVSNCKCKDERPFIHDLFNDKIAEVGHIQFIPGQNRMRITAGVDNETIKTYDIVKPRIKFLKFIFQHTNSEVKQAIRFYHQNSKDARSQE